jgi:hypothetical protein
MVHQNRRVGFEQLDDGIGCSLLRAFLLQAFLEKACARRNRLGIGNADKSAKNTLKPILDSPINKEKRSRAGPASCRAEAVLQ